MTLEQLYKNLDTKLTGMDGKLDSLHVQVVRHDQNIITSNREVKELKERLSKVERWMWLNMGAGGAAGAGLAKLLLT